MCLRKITKKLTGSGYDYQLSFNGTQSNRKTKTQECVFDSVGWYQRQIKTEEIS